MCVCLCGGEAAKTFKLIGNEKSTVISTAKVTQICKQKLYRP